MRRKRKQILTVLAGTLAVASFLILSSIAVVWANGLKYNPQTGSFEQTVLVAIEAEEREMLDVYVNNELEASQVPVRFRNLLPGSYTVEIKKTGFRTWKQTFRLSAGQVGVIDNPILLAEQPLVTDAGPKLTPKLLQPYDFGLTVDNGELRDLGVLITRFGETPVQVHRIKDYYLYQLGSELRIFVAEGNQDHLIYAASSTSQLPLVIYSSTWQIAVQDGELVKLINLRIPATTVE